MKFLVLLVSLVFPLVAAVAQAQQDPSTMVRVGSVSPRFQSYNIEMVEVTGGRFWKPYGSTVAPAAPSAPGAPAGLDPNLFEQRPPIDLSNPRLRKLAAALGPAYVRVSGTWANNTYFHDSATPAPATPPTGFTSVMTRAQWKGVIDFAHAVDAAIVTSFATSGGARDTSGLWTPVEAKKLIAYTQSAGGTIAAAEFMNEPTFVSVAGVPPGYNAASYGRDFSVFRSWFRPALPHAILLGPGSVGEGIALAPPGMLLPSKDLLAAMPSNPVDAFSYHFYGGASSRCAAMGMISQTTFDAALTGEWLNRTDKVERFYAALRDTYAPGKPMWITETGQNACGGDRWASTFVDTFRYLNQLGTLARVGVQVILHNTLAASDYALIDEATLTPRPNYWAALLWHRTMGTIVLDAGAAPSATVRIYAHCMKDHPGGVSLLALNLDQMSAHDMHIAAPSTRYTLTAPELMSRTVQLNGHDLKLTPDGSVPALTGTMTPTGELKLPPASISFFTIAGANNLACR